LITGAPFSPTISPPTDDWMNSIQEDQNSARNLSFQASKSYYYAIAEKAQTLQLIVLVANALFWPAFLAWKPDLKVWSALAALLIPGMELVVIERLQKKWRTCGAKIQEMFDCSVLRLPWNEFKVGEPPREEEIAFGVSKFRSAQGNEATLRDWYAFDFADLPNSHARLVRQRANAWWDSELRQKYIVIIVCSISALGLLSLVVGIATGITVEKLILAVIAPITPIVMWGIKEVQKQSCVVSDGERVVKHLDSLWRQICSRSATEQELEIESRSLQNEIYDRRKGNAVNPQWLYWKKRNEFQKLMVEAGNQLVSDYREAKVEK
jgi:hypothetical protein